jgi:curved DNA-binding protein CbpA
MAADEDDPYLVLGVTPDATPVQIAHAYRQLIRALHPDTQPNAGAASSDFTTLATAAAAYAILRDPVRRAAYDRSRHPYRDQHIAPPAPQPYRREPDFRAGPVYWHPE